MEWNFLSFNGRSGPLTTPLLCKLGERVRIRFLDFSVMDHHPLHLHGHTFWITGTEGGRLPESAWYPSNNVLVAVAQVREVEFIANNPGDWGLHCHMFHHMMNSMSSQAGPMIRDNSTPQQLKVRGYPQVMLGMKMPKMKGMEMPGMDMNGTDMKGMDMPLKKTPSTPNGEPDHSKMNMKPDRWACVPAGRWVSKASSRSCAFYHRSCTKKSWAARNTKAIRSTLKHPCIIDCRAPVSLDGDLKICSLPSRLP
ncbi:MAG: hypothetical protein B7Z55_19090 [Planctomycetales bacterium 12-60-4]|nr:MAG: hypothetical protein B7Z55_19090 [Planctomycetales bacterium 12-60-4]